MANITASMVKELRDQTGAGMMDCKAALTETGGNLEEAVDWLRKKGLMKAAKKAGRVAAEGLVGVAVGANAGALVEVNSETDFVARNDEFKTFVKRAAELGLEAGGDLEALLAKPMDGGANVADQLTALVARIGENMSVRRVAAIAVSPGVVSSYVHNAASPELGKIGVLVGLKSSAPKDKLEALGKQLAMHVAAAAPLALTVAHLPADVVERERNVQRELARQSGKPENVIEKMIEGRMRKFYEESVLLSQVFVIDGETSIAKVLEKASKDFGAPVEIEGFVRFQVGEGIEKAEGDFSDEVSKLAGR
ncbi:MAG: elongation factor Ts [Alphaproteobacteria bacterium]|nr:elongation factor Ts [Alphaproteobacteria bacterium]MBN9557518.1 elongation factor Ts [Alphaproteobacteria bacterium]MBN9569266.1 elongation factor Ts [Alphaproteobacteria bacterium]MBN9593533.1 elongation factor Ts [Alphaproteobacteria bacterium]OJU56546.1 MAG: translation elongation factor Ts [Alphaproteobacteria bacterium 62-8]